MLILLQDYRNIHTSHLQAGLSLCTQLDARLPPVTSLLPYPQVSTTTPGYVTAGSMTWSSSRSLQLFQWHSSTQGSGAQLRRVCLGFCSAMLSCGAVSSHVSTPPWHESGVLLETMCCSAVGPLEYPSQTWHGARQMDVPSMEVVSQQLSGCQGLWLYCVWDKMLLPAL